MDDIERDMPECCLKTMSQKELTEWASLGDYACKIELLRRLEDKAELEWERDYKYNHDAKYGLI